MGKWFALAATVAISTIAFACSKGSPEPFSSPGPHVVLITIDTLRADHLGAYGHSRATSPHIDALSKRGVLFEHAISQASWTYPSVTTMHTGLYPLEHGVMRYTSIVDERFMTLAEVLKDAGYSTMAIVSNLAVIGRRGLNQGFDIYDESSIGEHDDLTSKKVTDVAIKHLRNADRAKPLFLWVHYQDPHTHYLDHPDRDWAKPIPGHRARKGIGMRNIKKSWKRLGPREKAGYVDYLRGLYDEEIAFTDEQIGRVLAETRQLGMRDRTLFIVTSDHGELFSEHGRFFHGGDVWEELIRVPLIVSGAIDPSLRGKRVSGAVELRSIPATVTRLLGLSSQPFSGPSLLDVAEGKSVTKTLFAQGLRGGAKKRGKRAVYMGDHKLIENVDKGTQQLFNLADDPTESNDLYSSETHASIRESLRAELDAFSRLTRLFPDRAPAPALTGKQRRMLKALGYLE